MRIVHGIEEPFDILIRSHDTGKSEHRERWVVRMHAHVHPALLANRHDGTQEVLHVLTKLILCDAVVERKQLTEEFYRLLVVFADVAAYKTLGLHDYVLHKLMLVLGGHLLPKGIDLGKDVAVRSHAWNLEPGPFLTGTLTADYVYVEICKFRIREIQIRGSVRIRVLKIGAGPVEHRHEVVADRVDAFCREVTQAFLVVLYQLIPVRTAVLYAFAHRQGLHNRPAHAVALYIFTKVTDLFTRPHLAVRHVVKGGHYALHTYLAKHIKGYAVLATEPSPGLFHNYRIYFPLSESQYKVALSCMRITVAGQSSEIGPSTVARTASAFVGAGTTQKSLVPEKSVGTVRVRA